MGSSRSARLNGKNARNASGPKSKRVQPFRRCGGIEARASSREYLVQQGGSGMSLPLFNDDILFTQRILAVSGFYTGPLNAKWTAAVDTAEVAFDAATAGLR